jgi:hypothetical protein
MALDCRSFVLVLQNVANATVAPVYYVKRKKWPKTKKAGCPAFRRWRW